MIQIEVPISYEVYVQINVHLSLLIEPRRAGSASCMDEMESSPLILLTHLMQ